MAPLPLGPTLEYGLNLTNKPAFNFRFRFLILLFWVFAGHCYAIEKRLFFDIPEQRADSALREFSAQARQQVLFPYEKIRAFTTNSIRGEYTTEEAINALLQGTGLTYSFSRYNVLTVIVSDEGSGDTSSGRSGALGQENAAQGNRLNTLDEVVVVGSRGAPRSVGDSAVPVDVIVTSNLNRQGNTNMKAALRSLVPSFNVTTQAINDAATLIRPTNLRGLSADSTLLLLNGKRHHRAAVISLLGDGINDGAQGADISAIPAIALNRVEMLRDGASAQYGSDAIAGVINYVLKDYREGGSLEAHYGEYFEGDGDTIQLAGNFGLPLGVDGFANFSFEVNDVDPTSRSTQRSDAERLIAAGNTHVADPAQKWGSPDRSEGMIVFNLGKDIGELHKFYLFGNGGYRDIENGFFYRDPNLRSGVFSNDDGETLLIGDLTPDDGESCPEVAIIDDAPDPVAFSQVQADPNCWSFAESFPGGFTPQFGGRIVDGSVVVGVSGQLINGLNYDVSGSIGRNAVEFRLNNTVNASLGPDSPTSFTLGSHVEVDSAFNVDLSYPISFSDFSPSFNFAGGLEFREERFEVETGDLSSYEIGPLVTQGFSVGSNGFQGFSPNDASSFSRHNLGLYLDIEADIRNWLFLGVATRLEEYSDFGSTLNGKVTSRIQATSNLAFRGAFSTGFRAPTPGQSNLRSRVTHFGGAGELEEQLIIPADSVIGQLKGGKPLESEESKHASLGLVFEIEQFSLTLDYFHIKVEDRIALTSPIPIEENDVQILLAEGVADAESFDSLRFFTNDFDTTTQGVDVVANYRLSSVYGRTDLSFVFNRTKTNVDKFSSNITDFRVRQLEEGLPRDRWMLTLTQMWDAWQGLFRVSYYDHFFEAHADSADFPIEADSNILVDAELTYFYRDTYTISLGGQNITDEFPDKNPWSKELGATYAVTSPYGFNGGYYYIRFSYNF